MAPSREPSLIRLAGRHSAASTSSCSTRAACSLVDGPDGGGGSGDGRLHVHAGARRLRPTFRTNTTLNFINQLYNGVVCLGCNVTTSGGTLVQVTANTNTSGINFALSTSGRISGTITNADGGALLQNVSAQIFSSTGTLLTSFNTNASGFYQTSGLPAGTYYVRTAKQPSGSSTSCTTTCPARERLHRDVGHACDRRRHGNDGQHQLRAVGKAARISCTAELTCWRTSTPIQGVTLNIYSSTGTFRGSVSTNAAGFYQTSGLPAGTYFALTFNSAGYFNELYNDLPCNNVTCVVANVTTGSPITMLRVFRPRRGSTSRSRAQADPRDISLDFGSAGLWTRYNHTSWTQRHTLSPGAMASGDIDRDGRTNLIATFPGYGVWAWMNNTAWSQLHAADASQIATGDMDGNGRDDVIMVFTGLWRLGLAEQHRVRAVAPGGPEPVDHRRSRRQRQG